MCYIIGNLFYKYCRWYRAYLKCYIIKVIFFYWTSEIKLTFISEKVTEYMFSCFNVSIYDNYIKVISKDNYSIDFFSGTILIVMGLIIKVETPLKLFICNQILILFQYRIRAWHFHYASETHLQILLQFYIASNNTFIF